MSKTLIVTDSCADLTYDRLADSVMVVPFMYHSLENGVSRKDTRFYSDTASPSEVIVEGSRYIDIMDRLEYAYQHDLDVMMLYSSSEISKVNEAEFLLAFEDYRKRIKESGKKLRVVAYDTGLLSQALGILINNLVELEQKGYSFDSLIHYLKKNIHLYRFDFISDDVDCLTKDKKGLRRVIDKNKLGKSVMSVSGGKVVESRKVKRQSERLKALVSQFKSDVDLKYPVSIVYSDNEDLASKLYREINGYTYDLDLVEASKVVSSVIGSNSVGIAYKKRIK